MENLKVLSLVVVLIAAVWGTPTSTEQLSKRSSRYNRQIHPLKPISDATLGDWNVLTQYPYHFSGDKDVVYLQSPAKRGFGSMLPGFLLNVYKTKLPSFLDKNIEDYPRRMKHDELSLSDEGEGEITRFFGGL